MSVDPASQITARRGLRDFARTTDGGEVQVRSWDPIRQKYKYTPEGRRWLDQHSENLSS